MFIFSEKSLSRLELCDPRLKQVALEAIKTSKYDFGITETLRSYERQKQFFESGKSKTMKSRHLANINGHSEAFDIVAYNEKGKITWSHSYYRTIAQNIFTVSAKLGIPIIWGGLWESFIDCAHFQLL